MANVDLIEKNIGFAKQQKAGFPLLSDPTTETAQQNGAPRVSGTLARHIFYVGLNGKILAIDKNVKPSTSAEDIATTLAQLEIPLVDNLEVVR